MPETKADPWVFRDDHKKVNGEDFRRKFESRVQQLVSSTEDQSSAITALIQAGQLETALSDLDYESSAASQITDCLAEVYCGNDRLEARRAGTILAQLKCPQSVTISTPEGFAYYNLRPADFADAAAIFKPGEPTAVIGIRSIGTTLSAVVLASLRKSARSAERITVRPTGHPYDRITSLSVEQKIWITKWKDSNANFLIVDEGPGRSGSTFLSVAEALVSHGIPAERIFLFGSRDPDVSSLCANDAAIRWNRLQFKNVQSQIQERFRGCTYIGGGEWRRIFVPDGSPWPACWTEMERTKFLSLDKGRFYKFEGLGAHGESALHRARALAKAGFGSAVEDAGEGFAVYEVLRGRPLSASDLTSQMLDRIAQYLAFRNSEFRVPSTNDAILAKMFSFNFELEFGQEWFGDLGSLMSTSSVLTDAHMQPHEWIMASEGVLKTDATSHGDDHFLPGPCDIAWDLAGASVEWAMDADATEYLLARFQQLTGDDVRKRFATFQLAYALLRLSYCRMALTSMRGTSEGPLLEQSCVQYRDVVIRLAGNSLGRPVQEVRQATTPILERSPVMLKGPEAVQVDPIPRRA